jgi:transposase
MSKKSGTKSYPAEFREKAVRLVTERGYTIDDVAEQLGCGRESIRRWKESAKNNAAPDVRQRMENDESELQRLRRENKRLQTENEILKKATAYFAREVM